jgi:hypothetical protein
MKMFYGTAAAAVLAVGLALSGSAVAGEKTKHEVDINTTISYANGSMGSVRNSRDSNQFIGCYISIYNSGGTSMGACFARNAAGQTAGCSFFYKPEFESILTGMSDSSLIHFNWDESNRCSRITVQNFSQYEPRK